MTFVLIPALNTKYTQKVFGKKLSTQQNLRLNILLKKRSGFSHSSFSLLLFFLKKMSSKKNGSDAPEWDALRSFLPTSFGKKETKHDFSQEFEKTKRQVIITIINSS